LAHGFGSIDCRPKARWTIPPWQQEHVVEEVLYLMVDRKQKERKLLETRCNLSVTYFLQLDPILQNY
jgi:hypothetical protein